VSHHPRSLSSTAYATRTTDAPSFPLEERHPLNNGFLASSSSKSETPEPLMIYLNHARTDLMRQARYRSQYQRDTIIAYLQASSTTRKNRHPYSRDMNQAYWRARRRKRLRSFTSDSWRLTCTISYIIHHTVCLRSQQYGHGSRHTDTVEPSIR
jgi:hypothetical protein